MEGGVFFICDVVGSLKRARGFSFLPELENRNEMTIKKRGLKRGEKSQCLQATRRDDIEHEFHAMMRLHDRHRQNQDCFPSARAQILQRVGAHGSLSAAEHGLEITDMAHSWAYCTKAIRATSDAVIPRVQACHHMSLTSPILLA